MGSEELIDCALNNFQLFTPNSSLLTDLQPNGYHDFFNRREVREG